MCVCVCVMIEHDVTQLQLPGGFVNKKKRMSYSVRVLVVGEMITSALTSIITCPRNGVLHH